MSKPSSLSNIKLLSPQVFASQHNEDEDVNYDNSNERCFAEHDQSNEPDTQCSNKTLLIDTETIMYENMTNDDSICFQMKNLTTNPCDGDDETDVRTDSHTSQHGSDELSPNSGLSTESCQDFTDMTGIDVADFLQNMLRNNLRDRPILLQLENDMKSFINGSASCLRFPQMSSYHRMLVHRVATFFGLDHNVDQSGRAVVITRSKSPRIPCQSFESFISETENQEIAILSGNTIHVLSSPKATKENKKKKILKRDNFPINLNYHCSRSAKSKSLEQRKEEYSRVRARIFSQQAAAAAAVAKENPTLMSPTWISSPTAFSSTSNGLITINQYYPGFQVDHQQKRSSTNFHESTLESICASPTFHNQSCSCCNCVYNTNEASSATVTYASTVNATSSTIKELSSPKLQSPYQVSVPVRPLAQNKLPVYCYRQVPINQSMHNPPLNNGMVSSNIPINVIGVPVYSSMMSSNGLCSLPFNATSMRPTLNSDLTQAKIKTVPPSNQILPQDIMMRAPSIRLAHHPVAKI